MGRWSPALIRHVDRETQQLHWYLLINLIKVKASGKPSRSLIDMPHWGPPVKGPTLRLPDQDLVLNPSPREVSWIFLDHPNPSPYSVLRDSQRQKIVRESNPCNLGCFLYTLPVRPPPPHPPPKKKIHDRIDV